MERTLEFAEVIFPTPEDARRFVEKYAYPISGTEGLSACLHTNGEDECKVIVRTPESYKKAIAFRDSLYNML